MNDLDRKERASRFNSLMASDAFKELEAWANNEVETSMLRMDGTPASELNLGLVCEERGTRKGIKKVIDQIRFYAEGR